VPFLLKTPPYDPLKDFTPITVALDGMTCIVVNEAVPARSVTELFDYIRKNPGKLAYGHNGVGGTYHLNMEMLKQQLGLDVTPVPYKGGLAALQDAVAGSIPIAFSGLASAVRFAKAGKIRILATMDEKRHPDLPDVPSMKEQVPVFEKLPTGLNIYGPVGIPRPVLVRLNSEFARAGKAPELASKLKEFYIDPVGNSLEEFAAEHRRDYAIVQRAIKAANIPLQ
jgi:tripartite-type tricarboxylate transporter receptor subunit TctC